MSHSLVHSNADDGSGSGSPTAIRLQTLELGRAGGHRADSVGGSTIEYDEEPLQLLDKSVVTLNKSRAIRFLIGVLGLLCVATVIALIVVYTRPKPPEAPPRTTPGYRTGAVATTHFMATDAAKQVLATGGNAIDAAAVAQFMLNVVQPESTGIGGGLVALLYIAAEKQVYALDGREEAPDAFTEDAFCKNHDCSQTWDFWPDRATGGHPVGVPGTLAATALALQKWGTYSLAQAVAPAVAAARAGVPMSSHLYSRIVESIPRLKLFKASRDLFLNADATAPIAEIGQTWKNPLLADTLELIAAKGPQEFYQGSIAKDIVQAVTDALNPTTGLRGLLTLQDIAGYRAVFRQPVTFPHGPHTIVGMPSPSSGGYTMALMTALMNGLDLGHMDPLSVASIVPFINAQNIAWADRGVYIGDADFVTVPVNMFLNQTYAQQRRHLLMRQGEATATPIAPGYMLGPSSRLLQPEPIPDPKKKQKSGTTHYSIADKFGNVIAWTTTIEENLGSAVVVPGRGFLLNNELTDFDAVPINPATGSPAANRPQGGKQPRRTALGADSTSVGGKRPRSSMSPTLVLDAQGRPIFAMGSPGGSSIIGTVLNVLVNVVDFNMPLVNATAAPRIIAQNSPVAVAEEPIPSNTAEVAMLNSCGVRLTPDWGRRPLGFVQSAAITYDGSGAISRLDAVADTTRLDSAAAAVV